MAEMADAGPGGGVKRCGGALGFAEEMTIRDFGLRHRQTHCWQNGGKIRPSNHSFNREPAATLQPTVAAGAGLNG
jgi:hypothetical protein